MPGPLQADQLALLAGLGVHAALTASSWQPSSPRPRRVSRASLQATAGLSADGRQAVNRARSEASNYKKCAAAAAAARPARPRDPCTLGPEPWSLPAASTATRSPATSCRTGWPATCTSSTCTGTSGAAPRCPALQRQPVRTCSRARRCQEVQAACHRPPPTCSLPRSCAAGPLARCACWPCTTTTAPSCTWWSPQAWRT